jgi:dTDP-4-amino-4,6-dideoxygalactose transaminase
MKELLKLAKSHSLYVVEDSAQAHLAIYDGKFTGTIGVAGCFSFYPGKNLGAYGDAGAIVTADKELARKCRLLANHGREDKYNHQMEGYNSRLDSMQAAILSVKLAHIKQWTKRRREIAKLYEAHLAGSGVVTPKEIPNSESSFHLYVIRCQQREDLRNYLRAEGIDVGVHYPTALPFLAAYKERNYLPSEFPVVSKLQDEILSLPMYPELKDDQIRHISEKITLFYNVQK